MCFFKQINSQNLLKETINIKFDKTSYISEVDLLVNLESNLQI